LKKRVDLWLVERNYFDSREQAQRAIMSGQVLIDGKRIEKPSQICDEPAEVKINGIGPRFVSRGAHKLAKAVAVFGVEIAARVCLDAGASTGGFTDFLLQAGAGQVYAVDVGYGQLAWKLRQDPRVVVLERQNIRYLSLELLPEKPGLITADLSFISLKLVFAKFKELVSDPGELITLIKPQFEAGRDKVGKKGVVRDQNVHLEVLRILAEKAPESGWFLTNLTFSPLLGPEGNIEYLGYWRQQPLTGVDIQTLSAQVVEEAWVNLIK